MTHRQKAEAYNRIIEKATKMYNEFCDICKAYRDGFIPELITEPEDDERIRKELLEHCRNQAKPYIQTGNKYPQIQSWITWLEKQGMPSGTKGTMMEQKNSSSIETKFKVSDFIKHNKFDRTYKIISVNKGGTYDVEHLEIKGRIELFNADQNFHLWTIKDAKKGDVLFDGSNIFLVKEINGWHAVTSYLAYSQSYGIRESLVSGSEVFVPATKDQRDLLFRKMEEAGYDWNAEKKELNKFEHRNNWGEEDERMLNKLIAILDGTNEDDYQEGWKSVFLPWLKSLRSKNTWKPIV